MYFYVSFQDLKLIIKTTWGAWFIVKLKQQSLFVVFTSPQLSEETLPGETQSEDRGADLAPHLLRWSSWKDQTATIDDWNNNFLSVNKPIFYCRGDLVGGKRRIWMNPFIKFGVTSLRPFAAVRHVTDM